MEAENLKELFSSDGWVAYREAIEEIIETLFKELLALDPNPENFIKFVEIKSRINQLINTTYLMERDYASGPEKVEIVDETYKGIISRLSRKLFKRS